MSSKNNSPFEAFCLVWWCLAYLPGYALCTRVLLEFLLTHSMSSLWAQAIVPLCDYNMNFVLQRKFIRAYSSLCQDIFQSPEVPSTHKITSLVVAVNIYLRWWTYFKQFWHHKKLVVQYLLFTNINVLFKTTILYEQATKLMNHDEYIAK